MNDRIYPEKLLKDSIAEEQALKIKREIGVLYDEWKDLNEKICSKEEELQEICPHLNTKTEHGEDEGDYYNKGTYWTVEKCVLCEKEIYRQEGTSSYG